MLLRSLKCFVLIFALGIGFPSINVAMAASEDARLFFLHHSTGRMLLEEGDAREYLSTLNLQNGTDHVLWDHDYNYIGLKDGVGALLGYHYSVPNDNTDPEGLHRLWTTINTARDSILSGYDIIAFKSCFPNSNIASDEILNQYKIWYLDMRDVFDQHPEKTFVVMSPPPLHRLATVNSKADRARAFANWLGSADYLSGHPNVVYFNFFDLLAQADDGSATRNMLKYEFERSHFTSDSHPNALANQVVARPFIDFLVSLTESNLSPVIPSANGAQLHPNIPNPFNPSTKISFSLDRNSFVELSVFDVRGNHVKTLVKAEMPVGIHQVYWQGDDFQNISVASGIYFSLLKTDGGVISRKMQLLK